MGAKKREKGAIKGYAPRRRGRSNQDTEKITYPVNKYHFTKLYIFLFVHTIVTIQIIPSRKSASVLNLLSCAIINVILEVRRGVLEMSSQSAKPFI